MNSQKYLIVICLIVLGLFFGFIQESVKIELNNVIETGKNVPYFYEMNTNTKKDWVEYRKKNNTADFYNSQKSIEWMCKLSYNELIALKWVITFVFITVFFFINAYILNTIIGQSTFFKWTVYFYLIFFSISIIIFVFGKAAGFSEITYPISRKIAGGLQSLVPIMILLPTYWLSKKAT